MTAQAALKAALRDIVAPAARSHERLLDRRLILEQVRSGDLGFVQREHFGEFFADVEALLIADQGVSGPAEG